MPNGDMAWRLQAAYSDQKLQARLRHAAQRRRKSKDVEDILADAFLRAAEPDAAISVRTRGGSREITFQDSPEEFLLATVRTLAQEERRRAGQQVELTDDIPVPDDQFLPRFPSPEIRDSFWAAVNSLPVADSRLLTAIYRDNRSVRDIAHSERVHYSTVSRRHQRIIERLAGLMGVPVPCKIVLPVASLGPDEEDPPFFGWVKSKCWGSPTWTCGGCGGVYPVTSRRCIHAIVNGVKLA